MTQTLQIRRIRQLRGDSNLTEFSRTLGISRTYLSLIEAGHRPISAAVAVKLHSLFGDPLGFWLGNEPLPDEDLEGSGRQDPPHEDLPQTDPTAGLTPRGGRAA